MLRPRRLFWKLLLTYAGLILTTAVVFATLISAQLEQQVLGYLRERLRDDAVLLRSHIAESLAAGRTDQLQDLVIQLGYETGTRMTVVAVDGNVLADSEQDPARMEPHGDRPEIVQARADGIGVRTHVSRTLGIPMMYLAIRVDNSDGRPAGFVRVALPLQSVQERVASGRRLVWAVAVAVGVAALLVTLWVVVRIIRPVRSLTQAAKAIAAGEAGLRVFVSSRDELGTLAEAFNRMSSELALRMTQIREDKELLATVLGGMIEGVVAVDAEHRVLFANDAARALLELPASQFVGRPVWELVRHGAVEQAVQDAFAGDEPCRCEFELAGPHRRVVALHARRLPGEPSPAAVLVLHDVTELRRLENLRRDFVANVSHELKTPLSSIKAYAETLLSGAIDDRESNVTFLRQIEDQADRLHSLILDLLSLARIESGQEAFEIEPVNVAEAVQTCVARYVAAAASKRIELNLDPYDGSMHVLADAEGVQEILNNLVDNAIKYTPEGGRVTIRWEPDDRLGVIEVSDTGIGITPRDQARVFERFYRVDKARSRELGGTGLGLSIVKHLAQAFDGSVSVASEVGRGSTFSVRLPLAVL